MEILTFTYHGTSVPISFSRKKMRYIRLRVSHGGSVSLSAPLHAPESEIRAFVEKHAAWLYRKWRERQDRIGYMDVPFLSEKGETMLLGKKMRVVLSAKEEPIDFERGVFPICVRSESPTAAARAVEKKMRACAQKVCGDLIEEAMPVFASRGVQKPLLEIRKMRAKWGYCKCDEGIVALNLHLIKANLDCVEYVVLHELTHFLYRGHGEDFRRFMTRLLPDWRARRRLLNEGFSARED